MAYVADLITVLNLLFGEVTQPSSSKAPKVTGQAPNDGYQTQAPKVTSKALIAIHQTPKMSERRREIYYRITTKFPATAWNLSYMPQAEEFRTLLFRSLGFDPVSPPNSGNTGSPSSSGNPPSQSRSPEAAKPLPAPGPQQPPSNPAPERPAPERPTSERPTPERPTSEKPTPERPLSERPAPEPSPNVLSRFIGCLTNPCGLC